MAFLRSSFVFGVAIIIAFVAATGLIFAIAMNASLGGLPRSRPMWAPTLSLIPALAA